MVTQRNRRRMRKRILENMRFRKLLLQWKKFLREDELLLNQWRQLIKIALMLRLAGIELEFYTDD